MTKVRLIRNDGEVIVLDVTQYSMNITRSVPILNVPVIGTRYAADMNMVSADFRLSVVLSDDDCAASQFQKTAAVASIDFSALKDNSGGSHPIMMNGDTGSVSAADLNGLYFEIETAYTGENTTRKPVRVVFNSGSSSNTRANNPQTITVGISGVTTGAALASAIKTALEDNSLTPSTTDQLTTDGGTNFTDAFTISLGVGKNLATNCKITFTAKEKGFAGNNNSSPSFSTTFAGSTPFFETFGSGKDKSCKSAGDKLQDLIAYVGNANLAGTSGRPFEGVPLVERDFSLVEGQSNDYIIGMQLPYNSLITSSSSNSDYVERNMLIINGLSRADEEDSEANKLSVSTLFNPTDMKTGIAGTVVSMSFGYNAGENIYEGDLTFQPIDFIVGT